MKILRPACLALALLGGCAQVESTSTAAKAAPESYDRLLAKYARSSGVAYAAWKAEPADLAALDEVAEFYAESSPPSESDAALAWHLNAYNALMLHEMLKRYPTGGPLDGNPLFFKTTRPMVSGRKTSFDHLEQKVIRPTFSEPRVHFALNCASVSCPPLADAAFRADSLDATLDRLTRSFVNDNPRGVRLDGNTARISKIFDWYAEDFGGPSGVIPFINRYRENPIPADAKIEFMGYDWSLNGTPTS